MAVEAIRGCGFRKVGGLYLCGEGFHTACDRLPYKLRICPICGSGIKFSRGFQWIDWCGYAGDHEDCKESLPPGCPVCNPSIHTPLLAKDKRVYGLLWVGEAYYTPESFIQEALKMGVSRRIAAIPRNLKLGETWILFAHIRACGEYRSKEPPFGLEGIPGVFYAFRPQKAELLIWESEATEEKLAELGKKHITPVVIPDGDMDHDSRTSLKPKEEEKSNLAFERLRDSIRQ